MLLQLPARADAAAPHGPVPGLLLERSSVTQLTLTAALSVESMSCALHSLSRLTRSCSSPCRVVGEPEHHYLLAHTPKKLAVKHARELAEKLSSASSTPSIRYEHHELVVDALGGDKAGAAELLSWGAAAKVVGGERGLAREEGNGGGGSGGGGGGGGGEGMDRGRDVVKLSKEDESNEGRGRAQAQGAQWQADGATASLIPPATETSATDLQQPMLRAPAASRKALRAAVPATPPPTGGGRGEAGDAGREPWARLTGSAVDGEEDRWAGRRCEGGTEGCSKDGEVCCGAAATDITGEVATVKAGKEGADVGGGGAVLMWQAAARSLGMLVCGDVVCWCEGRGCFGYIGL